MGDDAEKKLDAWKELLRAHASLTDVLEKELREARGLPLSWYDVLVQLDAAGGRLRMHDLARAVLLSRAGLTRLVDRMAREGYVDRAACEADRRGIFVNLTPKGAHELDAASPGHLRGIADHFSDHVSLEEAAAMSAAFRRILDTLPPS